MSIRTKILHGKVDILLIDGLPEDAWGFSITHIYAGEDPLVFHFGNDRTGTIPMPPGNWQPVNWLDKISEDEANELVDGNNGGDNDTRWFDYLQPKTCFFCFTKYTAKESLLSLVESEVKIKNEFGKEPVLKLDSKDYDDFTFPTKEGTKKWKEWEGQHKAWESEEAKVWKNIYLLKKV